MEVQQQAEIMGIWDCSDEAGRRNILQQWQDEV